MIRKICLVQGGKSEAEISKKSSKNFYKYLTKLGFEVVVVDVSDNVVEDIKSTKSDLVFNGIHGFFGEDGKLAAVCDLLEIPYTHSGVLASALSMDKTKCIDIVKSIGLNEYVMDYVSFKGKDLKDNLGKIKGLNSIQYKNSFVKEVFIKPVNEGSSVDCHAVKVKDLEVLKLHDNTTYIVQERLHGKEYSSLVLGEKNIGSVAIESDNDFYDFDAKYIHPAKKTFQRERNTLFENIEKVTLAVHLEIGASDLSRSDFMVIERDGVLHPVFLEINVNPGFTESSIVPYIYAQKNNISLEQANLEVISFLVENGRCYK